MLNWISNTLDGVTMIRKMSVITSSGENYDIAFASNYVVNAQKGAYADLTELYKKKEQSFTKHLTQLTSKGTL